MDSGGEKHEKPDGFTPSDDVEEIEVEPEAEPSEEQEKSPWASTRTWAEVSSAILGWQRTHHLPMFPTYVWRGDSCQEASIERNQSIAAYLQNLVDSGGLDLRGHTVQVGAVTGYRVPLTGWIDNRPTNTSTHTYSVVQIKDRNGNHVGSFEVDTYFSNHQLPHGEVDFSQQDVNSEEGGVPIDVSK